MAIQARNIAVYALFGSAALVAGAWHLMPEPARLSMANTAVSAAPVFDLAQPGPRHTAAWLLAGGSNFIDGKWLGSTCRPSSDGVSHETYVLSRNGPVRDNWRNELLTLRIAGDIATLDHALVMGSPAVETTRSQSRLGPKQVGDFRGLLSRSGFASMAPDGVAGACHVEVITLESCNNGIYYGVMRMCQTDASWKRLSDLADATAALSK